MITTPAEIVQEQVRRVAAEGHDGTESFYADGTWINRTGPGLEHRRRWRLITCREDLISVQIEMPEAPDGHLIRNFAPASNDFLIEQNDIYEGVRLARVPDPK